MSRLYCLTPNHTALVLSVLMLSACASAPVPPAGLAAVRTQLNTLQANGNLAALAPVAITQAEEAVQAAEVPTKDKAQEQHLVFVADRKVNIAWAQAQSRQAQDQLKLLSGQQDEARLLSRTREADRAHQDASMARQDARMARSETDSARQETDAARLAADNALLLADELKEQINTLNARQTDRGLVVTLGDLLFDTGKANLKAGVNNHLTHLASFLAKYPQRAAIIEGHTDDVGSSDYNLGLSQRRADSVRNFLQNQGIASTRLSTDGKGEEVPIAGNDSASGRQQNRRVEVIITEAAVAAR